MINILFSILLVFQSFAAHDYHISVSDIVYNEQNQSLEIIQTVDIADFEKTLKKTFKKKNIDLLSEEQMDKNGELARLYLEENLIFYQNNTPIQPTWIGHEINDTNLTAYIELENITNTGGLTLQNTIMTERYRKQQNLVHWKFGDGYKTSVLNRRDTEVELTP